MPLRIPSMEWSSKLFNRFQSPYRQFARGLKLDRPISCMDTWNNYFCNSDHSSVFQTSFDAFPMVWNLCRLRQQNVHDFRVPKTNTIFRIFGHFSFDFFFYLSGSNFLLRHFFTWFFDYGSDFDLKITFFVFSANFRFQSYIFSKREKSFLRFQRNKKKNKMQKEI